MEAELFTCLRRNNFFLRSAKRKWPSCSSLDSQLYIYVTTPYTMPFFKPFFKAASENTLLLPIIEGFGRLFNLSQRPVLLERERLFFYQGL